jgi:hypothetical protein
MVNFFVISNLLMKDILISKKKKNYYFLSFIFSSFPKIPIPTVFNWQFGGAIVYVLGDWDCWQRHVPLCHSGWEFSSIIPLFPGRFHYKFSVDGKWKYAPTHKIEEDFRGTFNNIVEIKRLKKYCYENISLLDTKTYPNPGIKDFKFLKIENLIKNVPLIPPHLLNFVHPEIKQFKNCFLNSNYFSELSILFQIYLNHIFFFSLVNFKKKNFFKNTPVIWIRIREKVLTILCFFDKSNKKSIDKKINLHGF